MADAPAISLGLPPSWPTVPPAKLSVAPETPAQQAVPASPGAAVVNKVNPNVVAEEGENSPQESPGLLSTLGSWARQANPTSIMGSGLAELGTGLKWVGQQSDKFSDYLDTVGEDNTHGTPAKIGLGVLNGLNGTAGSLAKGLGGMGQWAGGMMQGDPATIKSTLSGLNGMMNLAAQGMETNEQGLQMPGDPPAAPDPAEEARIQAATANNGWGQLGTMVKQDESDPYTAAKHVTRALGEVGVTLAGGGLGRATTLAGDTAAAVDTTAAVTDTVRTANAVDHVAAPITTEAPLAAPPPVAPVEVPGAVAPKPLPAAPAEVPGALAPNPPPTAPAEVPGAVAPSPPPAPPVPAVPVTPAAAPPDSLPGEYNLRDDFRGEENPDNKVWGGTGVKYLTDAERQAYRLQVKTDASGQARLYDASGKPFDTGNARTVNGGPGSAIFVLGRDGNLYASMEQRVGEFHHSSLMAGQPVLSAGEMTVENGVLKSINPRSGHYRPDPESLDAVLNMLGNQGVDVSNVQRRGVFY